MPDQTDNRLAKLSTWLGQALPEWNAELVPIAGDASFRRYFRTKANGLDRIVMDAPPATENLGSFVSVAHLLGAAGVTVPEVHAADIDSGYAVLSDMGKRNYLDVLSADNADRLYRDAISALTRLQRGIDTRTCGRPDYDEALLRRELNIFSEWFVGRLLGIECGDLFAAEFERVRTLLIAAALEQPRVFVHRDYHSRNLMVCPAGNPGILDFQDAVIGPIAYDLASLLRDCYVAWPESRVAQWREAYLEQARQQDLLSDADAPRFERWFDLTGLQRHLKAIGIFARLKIRDGKSAYLRDIPRTLRYVSTVCAKYPELEPFGAFILEASAPAEQDAVFA